MGAEMANIYEGIYEEKYEFNRIDNIELKYACSNFHKRSNARIKIQGHSFSKEIS